MLTTMIGALADAAMMTEWGEKVTPENAWRDCPSSFAAARPVWPEGREREWNCQVGFTAEFDGAAAKDAVLRFTGATMCRVFLNGEFFGYGPARAGQAADGREGAAQGRTH